MHMVRPVFLTAALVASICVANAETRPMDNYRSIIDRNPFGLRPPPPPPAPVEPPKAVEKPAEFYLTGISTVGYPKKPKRAYLMNKDNTKKDKEKYYTLTLNDKEGDLRLDEVDEKGRRVKITYQDKEMWLSMKDNGVPAPSGPAPMVPGMPGLPGIPGMNPAQPGIVPQPSAIPLPSGVMPNSNPVPQPNYPGQNPNRRIPRSGSAGMMSPGAQAVPNIPGPTINFGNNPMQNPNAAANGAQAQPPVDPVRQYLQLKAEENINARQGVVTPPIPTL
jgi:hypothetical protein